MKETYLLRSDTARRLYAAVRTLPIVDYHCHLSPQEIYEDRPFDNIGEMWLSGDHYKWRLMRTAGIDERYITGDADWHEKFLQYAAALELAAGNPLYHWSHMELSQFFGIDDPLTAKTAEDIWQRANAYIRANRLSPRQLMCAADVRTVCTTDDIADSLCWHQKLREDTAFTVRVLPSFRTDLLLLMRRDGYGEYLTRLSAAAGVPITDLASLREAVEKRLVFFTENGCRFSDVGIPYFPETVADEAAAADIFARILRGEPVDDTAYTALLGYLYVWLGNLYRRYDVVMQWHLSVIRNASTALFTQNGADCGGDCVGDPVSGTALARLLDAIQTAGGLPKTILYTLNETTSAQMASVAGAFPEVRCGAAWWFCDHKRGIRAQMEVIAENACFGRFLGMLTDSRSFLSYARHDYFRRILCDLVGEWVDGGEFNEGSAVCLVKKIAYENIRDWMEEKK